MKDGFYEKIITEALAKVLEDESDKTMLVESFNKSDGAVFIQRYFQDILKRALSQITEERDELAKKKLIEFTNELVKLTARFLNDAEFEDEIIASNGEILKAFFHASTFAQVNLKDHIKDTLQDFRNRRCSMGASILRVWKVS
jgi:hypothetical protein